MTTESDIKINNTVILATITEVTRAVINNLDGNGVDTKSAVEAVEDQVLNKLIASRVRARLSNSVL
mgnify:CR=1 FL=1